ncbi:MAG: MoaD/ThiS family protein [Coriobacteriia bacterium]|nr:MoaD/ThiS family protein [Coriobacteriia bacterium]
MSDLSVTVRMFGVLCTLRKERDEPTTVQIDVPAQGIPASQIADQLGLPDELIEGVFCNHTVYGMGHIIHPGDRVAFVPYGTPGPHRFALGLYDAGRGKRDE